MGKEAGGKPKVESERQRDARQQPISPGRGTVRTAT